MPTIRKMTVFSLLTAAAVAGRLAIHGINIQPATLIIILSGWFFGWKMGLAEGMMVAFVSDLMLGLGYWTPFQMLAWGMIGLISALLPKRNWIYILWLGVSGFLFGLIMALSYFMMSANWVTVWGMWLAGLPFDFYHAAGNLAFGIFSPPLFKVFEREARRLENRNH
ncbi:MULTISPECIES: ECF transporter S component [unclassified Sporolactobacillus]|uniref:ECF transporter S component n=1 Tax=unclassified Sporolactobacillus TaxID=2628533 RepID=UPI0023674238|nr:ECF transporter S component [Sporolactobacillus sp. CQH2019]MDD9147536.1 ECF transporter S component [Sporolactobacillus sp. CQH2019]